MNKLITVLCLFLFLFWPLSAAQADITDTLIELEVEALISRSSASLWKVKVDVQNGVVTLSGAVNGEKQQEEILRAVQSAPGVTKVVNLLRIIPDLESTTPEQIFSDQELNDLRYKVFKFLSLAFISVSALVTLLSGMLWWFVRFLSSLEKSRRASIEKSWS